MLCFNLRRMARPMIKNVVFGDTGGHAVQLMRALEAVGVDLETYKMPEDLRIIHLGDLIHKGPDSHLIIEVVDQLMNINPNQWKQLIGNHESQHLDPKSNGLPAPYFWSCDCTARDEQKMNEWWNNGLATFSWGLDSFEYETLKVEISAKPKIQIPHKGIFFSHGGLTYLWWKNYLKGELSAVKASEIINALPLDVASSPGELMGVHNAHVGPIWAIGNYEVWPSWEKMYQSAGVDMPFIQIHGHTQSYSYGRNKWWPVAKAFQENTKLNPQIRSVTTKLANSLLIGMDPGYSEKADTQVQPFLTFESKN